MTLDDEGAQNVWRALRATGLDDEQLRQLSELLARAPVKDEQEVRRWLVNQADAPSWIATSVSGGNVGHVVTVGQTQTVNFAVHVGSSAGAETPPRSQHARWSAPLRASRLGALQLAPGRSVVALIVAAALTGGGYGLFVSVRPQQAVTQRTAPGDRFDAQLDRMLRHLDDRRLSAREQMAAARTRKGQAAAADEIVTAYREAARDLPRLTPPADRRRQADVLHEELVTAGHTFKGLASAARLGHRRTYDHSRSAVKRREVAINGVLAKTGTKPQLTRAEAALPKLVVARKWPPVKHDGARPAATAPDAVPRAVAPPPPPRSPSRPSPKTEMPEMETAKPLH